MANTTKTFKQVNIAIRNWNEYNKMAEKLTKATGFKVSIPALIHKAVSDYKENNELL